MRATVLLFLTGVWLGGDPSFISAQGRRPPLPWESFTAVVDGKIRTDLGTVPVEGAPALALRDVERLFGGRQSWHRVSRKVTYEVQGRRAEFTLDAATVAISGKTLFLDSSVQWWTGQVYVPLSMLVTKEFQEFAESTVKWDPAGRVLTVEPVPSVSSPRFYSYPDKSRVVLELGPRVHYRVMAYRAGRLFIRFFGGRSLGSERLEVKDGLVESVQLTAWARSSDLTLALSENAGAPRVRLQESPRQLVVEVLPRKNGSDKLEVDLPETSLPRPAGTPAPGAEEESDEETSAPAAPISPLLALSPIKTIVIDAGHGGKDAGAVGLHGTLEKNVNLEITRALAHILKRERRFKVILTRNDDTFIPLEERTEIANKNKADLFVSIHSNSAISSRSNGFEIYFLSEKATDEAAAAVARRENAVVELEGITGKTREKLQELLWALARTETMNESSEMAALMAKQVGRRLSIPNRGVKQAGFYVLKGANMPAVLVESAFISHSREEGYLRSRRFQNKLVDGLYAGLLDYEKRKIQVHQARLSPGGR